MVKLLFIALAFAMYPLTTMAQYGEDYEFDPNKTYYVWRYYGNTFSDMGFTEDYYLHDSYDNNGKAYRMVLEEGDSKGAPAFCGGELDIMIGVREKDGCFLVNRHDYLALMENDKTWNRLGDRQYIPYRQTDDGELVLYDFNMKPGDKYPSVEGHEDIFVTTVEEMTTRDGVSRRLLTLNNGYKLLEGIGCLNSVGLFFFYLNPVQNANDYTSYGLSKFFKRKGRNSNIEMIYQQGDENTSGVSVVKDVSHQSTSIYNLNGHSISSPPARGLYIKDGKKIVAR